MPRLGNMPIDRINRADVLAVLIPIWGVRQETARRVRKRIRTVLQWSMAHGHRDDNPAGEAIDGALSPMPRLKAHLRAMPYAEVALALSTVGGVAGIACIEMLPALPGSDRGPVRGSPQHPMGGSRLQDARMAHPLHPNEGQRASSRLPRMARDTPQHPLQARRTRTLPPVPAPAGIIPATNAPKDR